MEMFCSHIKNKDSTFQKESHWRNLSNKAVFLTWLQFKASIIHRRVHKTDINSIWLTQGLFHLIRLIHLENHLILIRNKWWYEILINFLKFHKIRIWIWILNKSQKRKLKRKEENPKSITVVSHKCITNYRLIHIKIN